MILRFHFGGKGDDCSQKMNRLINKSICNILWNKIMFENLIFFKLTYKNKWKQLKIL